jgi:predicted dehydrogenase
MITRRTFLQGAGLGLGGLALGRGAAAQRVNALDRTTMGFIGVGVMGLTNLLAFLREPSCQAVAVCDVDATHRERAKQVVDQRYSAPQGKGCAAYGDFREVLAREDIDAVMIAAPPHWHGYMALAALRAGKDVYCEKPLALTIDEGKRIVDAVRRYGRVFELGTQNRSHPVVRRVCELVRNGYVGEVERVDVGLPPGPVMALQPPMPVPPELEYDMWLGPAPWAPYTEKRCHYTFRVKRDYSGGVTTDLGTHYFDAMHWALGLERTGPVRIEGEGVYPKNMFSDVVTACDFSCAYANGLVAHGSTDFVQGCKFHGSEGWLFLPLGGPGPETNPVQQTPSASDPAILKAELGANDIRLRESPSHHRTFLESVRNRTQTAAPVDVGHRSTSVCHLANLAMELGRPLEWNPEAESFPHDPEANAQLTRPMRAAWRIA